MTKATTTSTASRRGMLVGTTAALMGAVSLASARPAVTGEGQDSALLMACAEFHRTHADLQQWYATGWEVEPPFRESEAHRLWQDQDDRFYNANVDSFAAVEEIPAKTPAGVAAKAKVLAEYMSCAVVNLDGSMTGATTSEVFAYILAQEAAQIVGGVA
jgi:hypothetical protein